MFQSLAAEKLKAFSPVDDFALGMCDIVVSQGPSMLINPLSLPCNCLGKLTLFTILKVKTKHRKRLRLYIVYFLEPHFAVFSAFQKSFGAVRPHNGNGNGNEFIERIFYYHIQMRFTSK